MAKLTKADRTLIEAMRHRLAKSGDPKRAKGAQAYMKSEMPFRGLAAPEQRAIYKEVFTDHPLGSFTAWKHTALTLWREAGYREERYAAIELTGYRSYSSHQRPSALPMYEEFIVDGAWWDYVDAVAIGRVGRMLLRRFPKEMKPVLRRWAKDPDMWRRRSAIIAQVGFKGETDLKLLYGAIEPNLDDSEFFIRKAIGWALRDYAWFDPDEVERYVDSVDDRISGLSRREALKNLHKIRGTD